MSAISAETLLKRHQKLSETLQADGFAGVILNPSPSLVYFTGMHFHLSERPVVFLYAPGKAPALVLPELEALKTKGLEYELNTFTYPEDPTSWGAAFEKAVASLGINSGRIAVESRNMRYLELGFLQDAMPEAKFVTAEESIAKIRMYKGAEEIAAMRKAAQVAQDALQATMPVIKVGATEREIANELTIQLLKNGSEPEMPFAPIVASGPNSANPHAFPTDRKLQEGDLLIIDWGASVDGYFSDITRTFAIGEVELEFKRIHEITLLANTAARNIAAPGITCGAVDREARDAIEDNNYGEYFNHRTGHGLGMEGHEEPYMRSDNTMPLETGMTFTIEPGIYLAGRGGVRIEDDVLVTEDGLESFTDLPRELITIN